MNSLNSSYKVISNFILSGGLGYITYWILETSEIISSSKDTTRTTFLSLLFSVPNYFLYSSLYNCLALPNSNLKTLIALLITLALIAFFAPPICRFLINFIFFLINLSIKTIPKIINSFSIIKWLKSLIPKNKAGVSSGDPWTINNKSSRTLVYLYNFNKKLLVCGYGKAFETNADSISITPCEKFENQNTDYDEIIKYTFEKDASPIIDEKCCDSNVYVNLNKQFIMIIFEVKKIKNEETKE